MREKQRYLCFALLSVFSCLLPLSRGIAAQSQSNQTLLNHQRARNLNKEGFRAYRERSWELALKKFAQSMELDPYYTYPIYNAACVLSLRGRPQDSYRIYLLLLEVLLQESGGVRSIHQAKMQRDSDLAWFKRHKPELFILLNSVVVDYDSRKLYRNLRQRGTWSIQMGSDRHRDAVPPKPLAPEVRDRDEPGTNLKTDLKVEPSADTNRAPKPDIGYTVPLEERKNSITVTPDDKPFDPAFGKDELFDEGGSSLIEPEFTSPPPSSKFDPDFDPFSGENSSIDGSLFGDPDGAQKFPGFDDEESNGFLPFVPQSLRPQYMESKLTLNLVSQSALATNENPSLDKNRIYFRGYRYSWRFNAAGRLFEMQGFFVIRGNVLVLETFASSPKEIEGLPFDWEAFRSLFFIYQPQRDEFQAVTSTGEQIKIF